MTLSTALLLTLNNVHPLMAREEVVHVDVNCLLPAPVTLTEVRAGLAALERRRLVITVRSEDDSVLWKITARGRASLAEITRL
jgi:hypothetical protein